jgi:hypothetical protein
MAKKKFNYLEAQTFEQDEQGRYYIHSSAQREQFKARAEAETKIRQTNELKQQIQDETNAVILESQKEIAQKGNLGMRFLGGVQTYSNPRNWAKGVVGFGGMLIEDFTTPFISGSKAIGEQNAANNLYTQSKDLADQANKIVKTDRPQAEALLKQSQALFEEANKFAGGEATKRIMGADDELTGKEIFAKSALAGITAGSFAPIGGVLKGSFALSKTVPAAVQGSKTVVAGNLITRSLGLGDIYQVTKTGVQQGLKQEVQQTVIGQAVTSTFQAPITAGLIEMADDDGVNNYWGSLTTTAAGAFALTLGFGYAGRALGSAIPQKTGDTTPELPTTPTKAGDVRKAELERMQSIEGDFLARNAEPTQATPTQDAMPEVTQTNKYINVKTQELENQLNKLDEIGNARKFTDEEEFNYNRIEEELFNRADKEALNSSLDNIEQNMSKSGFYDDNEIKEAKNVLKQYSNTDDVDNDVLVSDFIMGLSKPKGTVADQIKLKKSLELANKRGISIENLVKAFMTRYKDYDIDTALDIAQSKINEATGKNIDIRSFIQQPTQDPIKQSLGAFDPNTTIPMVDLTETVKGNNIDFNPDSVLSINSARKAVDDLALLNGNEVGGRKLKINTDDPKYKEVYDTQIKPLIDKINAVDEVAPVNEVSAQQIVEVQSQLDNLKTTEQEVAIELGQNEMQLEALLDELKTHPGKTLHKYANKKEGKLPEITGKGSKYGRQGDSIMTELGFTSDDEAQDAYQSWLGLIRQRDSLKANIKESSTFLKDITKEQQTLQKQLEGTQPPIESYDQPQFNKIPTEVKKFINKVITKDKFKTADNFLYIISDYTKFVEINKIPSSFKESEVLAEILKKSDGLPNESNILWAIARKPNAFKETRLAALSKYEKMGLASDEAIENIRKEITQPQFNKIPAEEVELEVSKIYNTLENEGFNIVPEKVRHTPNIDKVDEKLAKGEQLKPEEFEQGMKEFVNSTGKTEVIDGVQEELTGPMKKSAYVERLNRENPGLDLTSVQYKSAVVKDLEAVANDLIENNFDEAAKIARNINANSNLQEIKTAELYINKLIELGKKDELAQVYHTFSRNATSMGQKNGILQEKKIGSPQYAIKQAQDIRMNKVKPDVNKEIVKVKQDMSSVAVDQTFMSDILDNITCQ